VEGADKMKKEIAACIASAILLGFALMMLPLAIETGPPTYIPQPQFTKGSRTVGDETLPQNMFAQQVYGFVSQPRNILPTSLVFLSGLIVALGVYTLLKRRMI